MRPPGVGEGNLVEFDGAARCYERLGAGAIGHVVRVRDGLQSLVDDCKVLRYADQGQGQLARAVQDAEGQGGHHHDLPRGDGACTSKDEWTNPASLQMIAHKATSCRMRVFSKCSQLCACVPASTASLAASRRRSRARAENAFTAQMLVTVSTNSPLDEMPLLGMGLVQRPTADTVNRQGDDQHGDDQEQDARHAPVHRQEQDEGAEEIRAGWQNGPGQGADDAGDAARGSTYAAAERASQMIGEIAHADARTGARKGQA